MIARRWFAPACAALWLIGIQACSRGESQEGKQEARQPRVVSISPSATESVFALGLGAYVVGRSEHCTFPVEARALPVVGGYATPNLEAILALRPTLVVGARGPASSSIAETLDARGIPHEFPPSESTDDAMAFLLGVGEALGARATAERVVAQIGDDARKLEQDIATWASPSVVVVVDWSALVVAGPGSFLDELTRRARAKNLITQGGHYPSLNLERLLALDPDVIVDASQGMGDTGRAPAHTVPPWSSLRAVREGRVRALTSEAALRPGPRVVEALRATVLAVHGREP